MDVLAAIKSEDAFASSFFQDLARESSEEAKPLTTLLLLDLKGVYADLQTECPYVLLSFGICLVGN